MATLEPSDQLRFSPESLEFRDDVRNRLTQRMRELAVERVLAQHRERIMEDDFKAVLPQAVREILAEFGFSVTIGG
ncbi:MAG TPA: hypothetical protein VNH11_05215 [Pirellulales bacterium]|nr:hypothetical protein [Pirellulales bacterium]